MALRNVVSVVSPHLNKAEKHSDVQNVKLLRHLKIMFYLGYLPIEWTEETDSAEILISGFKNSRTKSALIAILDILIATLVVTYIPVWHLLNVGSSFDLKLLATTDYYVQVFNGTMTDAFTQLMYLAFPTLVWWIYVKIGNIPTGLNQRPLNTRTDLQYLIPSLSNAFVSKHKLYFSAPIIQMIQL